MSELCKTHQVFTEGEEKELAKYILDVSRMYFPITTGILRQLAYELVIRNSKKYPLRFLIDQYSEGFCSFMHG